MDNNNKQYEWLLDGIDCANCASKVERGVAKVAGVANSNVNYMTQTLSFEIVGERDEPVLAQVQQKVAVLEPDVVLKNKADGRLIGVTDEPTVSSSDGKVVEGTSAMDTSALTGESVPRSVAPSDSVLSGAARCDL